jgi:hypothetical protein
MWVAWIIYRDMPDLDAEMGDNRNSQLNQQTVLARSGELDLNCDDLDAILHEACWLVGDALDTQVAKVDRTCLGTYLGELSASLLRFHGTDVSTGCSHPSQCRRASPPSSHWR